MIILDPLPEFQVLFPNQHLRVLFGKNRGTVTDVKNCICSGLKRAQVILDRDVYSLCPDKKIFLIVFAPKVAKQNGERVTGIQKHRRGEVRSRFIGDDRHVDDRKSSV